MDMKTLQEFRDHHRLHGDFFSDEAEDVFSIELTEHYMYRSSAEAKTEDAAFILKMDRGQGPMFIVWSWRRFDGEGAGIAEEVTEHDNIWSAMGSFSEVERNLRIRYDENESPNQEGYNG